MKKRIKLGFLLGIGMFLAFTAINIATGIFMFLASFTLKMFMTSGVML